MTRPYIAPHRLAGIMRGGHRRLDGPARHLRIVRTFRDDFADFIADIRGNPSLALVCAGGGAVLGLSATVGLAFVWSLFL